MLSLVPFTNSVPTIMMSQFWKFGHCSNNISRMQVIEDITSDGCRDVFVATPAIYRYDSSGYKEIPAELLFLDGRNGSVLRSIKLGMSSITSTLYVGGFVIASFYSGAVKVYDLWFRCIYNLTFSEAPQNLMAINSSMLLFGVKHVLVAFDVPSAKILWNWTAPSKIIGILSMSDRIACGYSQHVTILRLDGSYVCEHDCPHVPSPDGICDESLHRLDDSRLLFMTDIWVIFGQSPNTTLRMLKLNGDILEQEWCIDIGNGAANKPYAISDINSDGISEFICRRKEDDLITMFNGADGKPLYSIGISAHYVRSFCIIGSTTTNATLDVAIGPYTTDGWHGLYLVSIKPDYSNATRAIYCDIYEELANFDDLNGDGLVAFVGATIDGKVICWEAYGDFIPEFPTSKYFFWLLASMAALIGIRKMKMTRTRERFKMSESV